MLDSKQREDLFKAKRTDPDPRVRHRAQAVLLLDEGHSVSEVARLWQTARHCIQSWRDRFLASGIPSLVDKPHTGRPCKLGPDDLAWLENVLSKSPKDYGFLSTNWTVIDLTELLAQQRKKRVSKDTVHRALLKLGFRYRRPRLDLTYRQDPEAVAAVKEVLDWLKKSAPEVMEGFTLSSPMRVKSTPILTWQKPGGKKDSQ